MHGTPNLVRYAKHWGLAMLVVVCAGFGVWGLSTAVGWAPAVAALVVAVLAAFATFNEIAGRVAGGVVIGTLVLVGANVVVDNVVDWLNLPRPKIIPGLAFAVVVFGVATGWYLRGSKDPQAADDRAGARMPPPPAARPGVLGRGNRWGFRTAAVTAAALAIFLMIDVPIIVERGKASVVAITAGVAVALLLAVLGWWCRRKPEGVPPLRRVVGLAAPVTGLVLLGVVPIVLQQERDRGAAVPTREQVASKVDVRIVTDGSSHTAPAGVTPDPSLAGFDVRYTVGFADGDSVRWTLAGTPDANEALRVASRGRTAPIVAEPPVTRDGADPVLVLLVDGTPPVLDRPPGDLTDVVHGSPGEVGRWRRVAHAAREPDMPTFAVLQTDATKAGRARLDRWGLFRRMGAVVSLKLDGHRTATDTALSLAIGAPSARDDLALALAHRPVLLFDKSEPVPRPLSIEWLFADRRVFQCRDRGVTKTECDTQPTTDPQRLENNATHLRLLRPKGPQLRAIAREEASTAREFAETAQAEQVPGAPPAAAPSPAPDIAAERTRAPATAIYVNPVHVQRDGHDLLYLDYWWYLPDNPVTVGLKAFCGAGLVIPGITCHDHQSDWEGLTVVVDRTNGRPTVTAVQYAEHNTVVSFGWKQLRARWDGDAAMQKIVAGAENGPQRPLAYVASGTHSTYPTPCLSNCKQFAASAGEDRHGGELPWIGNVTNVCGASSCVHRLPTREGGRAPALWNAFTGTWGEQTCVLGYYCDSAEPPAAPGQQKRYRHPTRCTGVATKDWHFKRQPCDD